MYWFEKCMVLLGVRGLALLFLIVVPGKALSNDFMSGVSRFRLGDYRSALQYFLKAEKAGDKSGQLFFNIASTYVKLKQFKKASYYYSLLVDDSKWGDLAIYNLAIVAEKEGNTVKASEYYTLLSREAKIEKLRKIASSKLQKLPAPEPGYYAMASVAMGFDDNVLAFPDELQSSSSAVSDSYSDYFAYGSVDIGSRLFGEPELQGFLYRREYSDFESYNLLVGSLGLLWDHAFVDLSSLEGEFSTGLSVTSAYIDGDAAYNQLQLSFAWNRDFNGMLLDLAYLPSIFDGSREFVYLDGAEHVLSASVQWYALSARLQLQYDFEYNSREDLSSEDSRFSYSPLRHIYSGSARWPLSPEWSLTSELSYSDSRYSGKNLLIDTDGVSTVKQRQAQQLKLILKTNYVISSSLSLEAAYQFTNNNENFDIYTYQRNEVSLGVDYNF